MKVQSVIIIANLEKNGAEEYRQIITKSLLKRGIHVSSVVYRGNVLEPTIDRSDIENVDVAIVLGGDGTVLFSCRLLYSHPIPIIGVNLGTVGFITEVVREEWEEVFDKFVKDELGISERLMLSVRVLRDGREMLVQSALNDCVVSGSVSSRMVYVDVELSGIFLGQYRADGLIVSTPTGSTAYSLSAGGPILHPETDAMILTPICPHSLSNRPIVLPETEKVVLSLNQKQRIRVTLSVDGREVFSLMEGDRIEVTRLPQKALIVKSDKRSFYEVVRAKLN